MASQSRLHAPDQVTWIQPTVRPIVRATDLGSVQVLKEGNLYLLTDPFGDVHPDTRGLGLYDGDTRRLSCVALRVNGERPVLLQASAGGNWRGTVQMTNPRIERDQRDKIRPDLEALASQQMGIARSRVLTGEVFAERLRIVNHAERTESVRVDLDLAADGADIFEVRGWERPRRGVELPVAARPDRVTFRYDGLDGVRRSTHLVLSEPCLALGPADPAPAAPSGGSIRLAWQLELAPGEAHELGWTAWFTERPTEPGRAGTDGHEPAGVLFPPPPPTDTDAVVASYRAWKRELAEVRSDNELVNLTLDRGASDLRLLMNDGPRPGEHYIAAGVPWFTTLFGRDAIIAALEVLSVKPELAVQTLDVLASFQATEDDPERDAEPGKIPHELRTGEMARSGELPHRPYYGTIDATPLWLILLGATYAWTGDRALVDRLWPNALRALDWIDRSGDRDGDGFLEYQRRTERGLVNQGWKDSTDGIRDRHGALATGPIALAEVQGYVFDAKLRMAALARLRGEHALGERLEQDAEAIRLRFEQAFWLEDLGFYAMALDGAKRPMDAIASNAGQCLWTGIVSPDRAQQVVDRLLAPDLFSGWGIRSYAAQQPGYNPIGYHTGTVWPHDVALIAAGCKRYGYHDEANLLVERIFQASQHFPDFRLPELFCGFDRDRSPLPVPYPVACSPQAWAAGSAFLFVETMLGLRPHADRRELELRRPELPEWLEKVTITGLRLGDEWADLLFHRWRGGTSAEVLRKSPGLDITIRM